MLEPEREELELLLNRTEEKLEEELMPEREELLLEVEFECDELLEEDLVQFVVHTESVSLQKGPDKHDLVPA